MDDTLSIHTCHADCPKPLCVAQRTIATQQEAIDELVEGLRELLEAMTVRTLRGRDNVPAMRDEQGASMHVRALLSKHGERT